MTTSISSDENRFLHDLAGKLGIAMLLVGSVSEGIKNGSEPSQTAYSELSQACQVLEKMRNLIQERRGSLSLLKKQADEAK